MKFSDAVPISFDVQLGVGKGNFDFSGLHVKDFNLSTGAGDVVLSFDEPNPTTIENMNIESGVSKFDGRNLGNANFKHFRFQEGVGTSTLDFSGSLHSEVDVDLEVGMGVMTIIVPPEVGARVTFRQDLGFKAGVFAGFPFHKRHRIRQRQLRPGSRQDEHPCRFRAGSIKIRRH